MQSYLHRMPWFVVKRGVYEFREHFFTVDLPNVNHINVAAPHDEVKVAFQRNNMRPGWMLSYNYYGENGNLVRPEYKDDEYEAYQYHVRTFENDDGTTDVYPHTELCPVNFPKKHLDEVNMSIPTGIEKSKILLESEGLPFEVVEV